MDAEILVADFARVAALAGVEVGPGGGGTP